MYNISEELNSHKKDKLKRAINIYSRYRKFLIKKLQKMMKVFDYHDVIFYQTLFFLDTFLSHDITIEMSEKTILYYLVGYFLCSFKLKETDTYEPFLESFLDLEKGIYLSPSKIALYEVICIKRMKYNIFNYSAYDWLTQLISIGTVFNVEVDSTNEIIMIKGHRHSLINSVNKYALKLLLNLTVRDIFFKYSPMYLAFSIIQIAREKYIDKNSIKPKLFFKLIHLYDVDFNDYQDCYEEINSILKEEMKQNLKENKNEEENNKEETRVNNIKRGSVDKIEKSFKNKTIFVPNKMRSSKAVIAIKEDGLLNKTKEEEEIIKHKELSNQNKNNKFRGKEHLSIDCTSNIFKSSDTLPLIFVNSHPEKKELKELNPKNTQINPSLLNLGNEEQKEGKSKSSDELEKVHSNNIVVIKNKLLTSKKLPKINFEEIVNNKNGKIRQNKELNPTLENGRRRYKLKTHKNL